MTVTNTMRTRRGQFVEKLQEFLTQQATLNNEIIAKLPACSEALNLTKTPWVTDYFPRSTSGKAGWAYDAYHSPTDLAKWAGGLDVSDLLRINPALWQRCLIPGSFFIFGVPFALTERKEAVYQKSWVPSATQKWLVDFQIVIASNSGDTIDDDTRKLKVADALTKLKSKGLNYTVDLSGFSINPLPPTSTETLDAYLGRGGYLIDIDRVQGKKRIGGVPNGRLACSTFCKDPASGLPYCTDTINLTSDPDNVSFWEVYVTAAAPTYTITLKFKEYDPSWWQSALNTVGSLMAKFHKDLCTPGTTTNSVATQAVSTTQAKSTDPVVKAWATGLQWQLSKCTGLYAAPTPITPVTPEALAPVPAAVVPATPVETETVSAIAPKYQGCVSRFHKTRKTFSIYCPLDWKPSGLGADVTPLPPSGTTKVVELPVAPSEAPNVGTEDDPLYKKWWFWTIIGGVAVAGGVGGYAIVRRRRRRASAY